MEKEDNILTPDDVCKILKIQKHTLYRMARNGQIPYMKLGSRYRFRQSSLDQWLERNTVDEDSGS